MPLPLYLTSCLLQFLSLRADDLIIITGVLALTISISSPEEVPVTPTGYCGIYMAVNEDVTGGGCTYRPGAQHRFTDTSSTIPQGNRPPRRM